MNEHHELSYDLRDSCRLALVDAIYDTGPLMLVDVTINDGVQHTQVPVLHMAGFTAVPAIGACVLLIGIGADPANMRALPPSSTWRFGGLNPGDTVLYAADGTRVECRSGGPINIFSASTVVITAPDGVTINGNVTVEGDFAASGNVSDGHGSMELIREIFNEHSHPPNDSLPTPLMSD